MLTLDKLVFKTDVARDFEPSLLGVTALVDIPAYVEVYSVVNNCV